MPDRSAETHRRYDVDALRVFAFGLLILYHVGMFYVYDWGWHVKSAYQAKWLQFPMLLSNQWRMPLIFLISGLAVSFVRGKYSAREFALRRIWRLLLPLIFGMAVVVAPQPYFEALGKGLIEPGFWRFFGQYLTMQDFPPEAWDGAEIITWTWNHLWYLPYLLTYTLVLIPVTAYLGGRGRFLREAFQRMRGPWLIILPILPLLVYGIWIFPHFPYVSHAYIDDWYAHAMYFTFFLYGYFIATDDDLWAELAKLRKMTLFFSIVMFAAYYVLIHVVADDVMPGQETIGLVVVYLNRWLWIVTVLGWGHHALNRPMRWLPYATEAVYPWYILHQTITVTVGYQLSKFALGPVIEPALVLGATIAGCFAIHEYVIRRSPLLRPLFGLSYRQVTNSPVGTLPVRARAGGE